MSKKIKAARAAPFSDSLKTRLRARLKVFRGTLPVNACWPWGGNQNRQKYGLIWNKDAHSKTSLAHRVAFEAFHRPLQAGECVLHTCNNPSCCNPRHLRAGTREENAAQRDREGRATRGSSHHLTRLTESRVVELRAAYVAGSSTGALARQEGLSYKTIWKIVTRKTWKHVV